MVSEKMNIVWSSALPRVAMVLALNIINYMILFKKYIFIHYAHHHQALII